MAPDKVKGSKGGTHPDGRKIKRGKRRLFGLLPGRRLKPGNEKPGDVRAIERHFDDAFYRATNPDIDFTRISPLIHFIRTGWREGRDPCSSFSVGAYLQANPDVIRTGMNPFVHYHKFGASEGRSIVSSRRIFGGLTSSSGDLEWLGYTEVQFNEIRSEEGCALDLDAIGFLDYLGEADLSGKVRRLDIGHACTDVLVSIVIPCLNEGQVTVECLASLSRAMPKQFGVEVIVADNASDEDVFRSISEHNQIRYIRFDENIGFGPACNAGAAEARGKYVLFLNNDTQVAPGCIEALIAEAEKPHVGLVGPKILSMDGSLQEAGCLISRDGSGALVGYGGDPRTPRYNYNRPVEHVSGAAIMIRRDLFDELGGFDDVFAPAYCEDADLSLKVRGKGLLVVYVADAVIAHHLSKTTNEASSIWDNKRRLVVRNRQTLVSRWVSELAKTNLRTIAFYLPQYHPIPENDLWWGKGFTEWTNVTKTQRNFVGHDQPRYPADLGYYDLRVPEVMEQQAALARKYGISGFCYYYYSFDGRRLLEHPLERMLRTGKPDLPFCLCWANENWTRRWDGRDEDVLLGQSYSKEHVRETAMDLARYMRMDSYIRINGKPLVLVYRVKEIPESAEAMDIWRNVFREEGIGEVCIAMVESFELSPNPERPEPYGCDITVEFPAHGMVHDAPMEVESLNPEWSGSVHDYRELAGAFMRRTEPGFKRLRSVLVGWDNTPRHSSRSLVLENATPGAFQAWLEWTLRRTMEQNFGDERIVFINAWNEWGEGSYLEPDRRYGHAHLQAVRNAIEAIEVGRDTFVI